MSLEAEIKRGGLERGRFFYFPVWRPGGWSSQSPCDGCCWRKSPPWSRWNCRTFSKRRVPKKRWLGCPEMSVILYMEENGEEDRAVYVPVEPADPVHRRSAAHGRRDPARR